MTDELLPIWALDKAASAVDHHRFNNWAGFVSDGFSTTSGFGKSIIAHARTIAQHEQPPAEPAVAAVEAVMRRKGYMEPILYAPELVAELRNDGWCIVRRAIAEIGQ